MEASYGPGPSLSPVVVLLLGGKQSGKSTAGNAILGKTAFQKKTTRSSKQSGTVFGTQVTVVDTPGWLSQSDTPDRVSKELCRGLTLCHPELHVILLVLPITSTFGQEEWRAMEGQFRLLQTPILQRAIVLFTYGDKLGGLPIQEYIRQQGQTLHWLLERCGNRYQVMTNQSWASEGQVTELFAKIQKMLEVTRRPREVQDRMYSQLRRDLSVSDDRGWQWRQEEMEMTVVHEWRPQGMASGLRYTPTALPARPLALKPALSLILLGRRKSGKSSVGNFILDRAEFQIKERTTRNSVGNGSVSEWPVTVVDTPGWSLFGLADPEQVKIEIRQSLSLCPVGSKVCFLLVVPVAPFKEKDRRAVETHLSLLEGDVWRSTVVLFTYGEELGERTVESYIEENGEPLKWVMSRCGDRYHVFDTNITEDSQIINQLLQMVEGL